MKIIRCTVEDHRSADDIFHPKPGCQHLQPGSAGVRQQRRQISGMARVFPMAGIEMAAGVGKALPGAASPFVDVKGKKSRLCPGQPPYLRFHHDAVAVLKKRNPPPDGGVVCAAADPGKGVGIFRLLI